MSDDDTAVLGRIAEGVGLRERGERAGARAIFDEVWSAIGGDAGDPYLRCALAHSMADAQDDPLDELAWDRRALAAADELAGDERVAGFGPSLHLNLADVHLRLGNEADARTHAGLARDALGTLPDDGYRTMIADALDRIDATLAGS